MGVNIILNYLNKIKSKESIIKVSCSVMTYNLSSYYYPADKVKFKVNI